MVARIAPPKPGKSTKNKKTLSERAGLDLSARRMKRWINHGPLHMRAGNVVAVYLTSVLQFLAMRTLGTAADRSVLSVKRQGLLTADSIDGLMSTDPTCTYATLMRHTSPFNRLTVCARDHDLVEAAAKKAKRSPAAAAPAAE